MKSILFTGDMMHAALMGRKTETRRVIVPQPASEWDTWPNAGSCLEFWEVLENPGYYAPYQVGDIVAAKSTWAVIPEHDHLKPSDLDFGRLVIWYDGRIGSNGKRLPKPEAFGKSRPARFLPKAAWPRMPQLEITAVFAQRVQDITEAAAIAEGIEQKEPNHVTSARYRFAQLWDSINAQRGYGWSTNPWVWAYTFRQVAS